MALFGTFLEVYSIEGREVLRMPVLQQKMVLDISSFAPGIYTVRLNQNGVRGKAGKLIVQQR
jgi:hypothetical protein